ncbi:MAG: RNB domain-containing ribonuclease, partial [Chloroflexota bacterium]
MNSNATHHRSILRNLAEQAMLERGLLPNFSSAALAEVDRLPKSESANSDSVRDLRQLLWSSIDNDDTRDLDQLSVAEETSSETVKIFV